MAKDTTKSVVVRGAVPAAGASADVRAEATGAAAPLVGEGVATADSLAGAAALLDRPADVREIAGPGVGAERVAERIDEVRDRPVDRADGVAPAPPVTHVINADEVGGRRRVVVATRITHDGIDYAPDHPDPSHRSVLVNFEQYAELAEIGAVLPLSRRDIQDWTDDEI